MKNFENQLRNSMGTLIGRTSHAILNKLQKRFREDGHAITVEQWQVLLNLNNCDDQLHQQLAENTFKEKSTVTRILDGLEKKALVKRVTGTEDRRQKRIRITTKGRALLDKVRPLAYEVQSRALEGVDLQQMGICRDILLQMHSNVTAEE